MTVFAFIAGAALGMATLGLLTFGKTSELYQRLYQPERKSEK